MIIGIQYILFCRTFYKWENYFKSIHHYRKKPDLRQVHTESDSHLYCTVTTQIVESSYSLHIETLHIGDSTLHIQTPNTNSTHTDFHIHITRMKREHQTWGGYSTWWPTDRHTHTYTLYQPLIQTIHRNWLITDTISYINI